MVYAPALDLTTLFEVIFLGGGGGVQLIKGRHPRYLEPN